MTGSPVGATRFAIAGAGATLLVVDMQNDFIDPAGAFPVPRPAAAMARIDDLVAAFRRLGRPVIYTRHLSDPRTNPQELLLFPRMAEGGLREGSWGAEIHPDLAPRPEEEVIDKRRFDAFLGTPLAESLHRQETVDLVITGCQAQICCDTTARSASCRDWRVTMVADALVSRRPDRVAPALDLFARAFGQVLPAEQVLAMLAS